MIKINPEALMSRTVLSAVKSLDRKEVRLRMKFWKREQKWRKRWQNVMEKCYELGKDLQTARREAKRYERAYKFLAANTILTKGQQTRLEKLLGEHVPTNEREKRKAMTAVSKREHYGYI